VTSLISAVLTCVDGFVLALYLAGLFGTRQLQFYYGPQPVNRTVDDK
jgi:hypothetical protein